jgi:hypothetical protein
MTKIKLLQSLAFFAIAYGLTFIFNRFLPQINLSGIDIKLIIVGFGPLLSGLICYQIFKTQNNYQISFIGVRPVITYAIIGIAILLPILLITKVSKEIIIFSIITQFIYSFGEEFGWRHYLLNLTNGMNKWVVPFFIGTIWFFWHYSLLDNPIKVITGQDIPIFAGIPLTILILSLLSFLWCDLTIKTKSILIPTVAHSITKYGDKTSILVVIFLLLLLQIFWNKLKIGQGRIN